MGLWRVEVGQISHRYVDAPTRDDAIASVRTAIVDALDLRAVKAPAYLAEKFEEAGPIKRRNILAALDGLITPGTAGQARRARRQLARLIKYDLRLRASVREQAAASPPIDPAVLDRMARMWELDRVAMNRNRLRHWERNSPFVD